MHPLKPIARLILVLETQSTLTKIAAFSHFSFRILSITLVFRIPWIKGVCEKLTADRQKAIKMLKKAGEPVKISHNADIENDKYRVERLVMGIENVTDYRIRDSPSSHDLYGAGRNFYRSDIESFLMNRKRMRTSSCADIKDTASAMFHRYLIYLRKTVRIKKLPSIDWGVRYAVVTTKKALGIFITGQVVQHGLAVKFHVCHISPFHRTSEVSVLRGTCKYARLHCSAFL